MIGPSRTYICNQKGKFCIHLDSWYNGGIEVYGRCKKKVWDGIKSWPPNQGCDTPKSCPYLGEFDLKRP